MKKIPYILVGIAIILLASLVYFAAKISAYESVPNQAVFNSQVETAVNQQANEIQQIIGYLNTAQKK